jgi:hypothetical protein
MPLVVTAVIGPLVVSAPLVAALVICLVLTLKRRAQDPRGAQLVIVGLGLAFLSALLSTALLALSGIIPVLHIDAGAVRTIYPVVNVIASLLNAAGWILAALALIRTRQSTPPAPAYGPPPTA